MLGLATAVGVILVVSGLVLLVAASDVHARLPTQMVPRRLAVYPLALGLALLVLVGVRSLLP